MTLLSVLDQIPIRTGVSPSDAVQETLRLAEATDKWGYHRYWLAEHHSSGGLAGSTPEIMIGQVAARTKSIRVGSGGVMLSHYSSLKVAENFRMLETLFPGRIDLGIGRAPGSDQLTSMALSHGPGALGIEHFPGQIRDLMGYLDGTLPEEHPFARVQAMPSGPTNPELWLLGSSDQSAAYAAHFGCAFSFAHFIVAEGGERMVHAYREHFQPSDTLAQSLASIGIFVICADTEKEAKRLSKCRDLWMLRLSRGETAPVPTIEEAESYPYTDRELAVVQFNSKRTIAGDPEQTRIAIEELGRRYGVDEFVVVTICHDFEARLRSYELLAREFGFLS
ncbi:MAG: LLM class flavin-dependent oxidoreductase [Pseudomonadota bacterium]|nr:LLM class flavin-dependent oxidoreductase [Pseudomonadota bacterium]